MFTGWQVCCMPEMDLRCDWACDTCPWMAITRTLPPCSSSMAVCITGTVVASFRTYGSALLLRRDGRPLKRTRTTWGLPLATHSSPSGSVSGKTSSVLTLAWPRSVKANRRGAATATAGHLSAGPLGWHGINFAGHTWGLCLRSGPGGHPHTWGPEGQVSWLTTYLQECHVSREDAGPHMPCSARPPVWSAGPGCPRLVVILPAGCWSQCPCCNGICSTVSWSCICTSLCSTIGAGVFRLWLRTALRSDGMPARTRRRPWPGNLRSCWWPVCTENAVRTRRVSGRRTTWKGQRPVWPCVPSASGTWSFCCPLRYWMRPTWYVPAPRWTRKTCLRMDGSLNTFMSGSLARPVMHTVLSSWTSWHASASVLGTRRSNVARPVGCMMRRCPACSKQSAMAMAWWPSAVRLTTAGTVRARTSCPARACRRKPMPTAWLMRPTAVSCLQGSRAVVSTAASGLDSVGKCIPIGRSGLPCLTGTLKGVLQTTASTQSRWTCELHTACLFTNPWYGHLPHSRC